MTIVHNEISVSLMEEIFNALPCEHSKHRIRHVPEESASFIFRYLCPKCMSNAEYLICKSGILRLTSPGAMLGCVSASCGYAGTPEKFNVAYVPL
jgi:hypothetical protein